MSEFPPYEIEKNKDGSYRAFVYDSRLASRLNRSLKTYPKSVDFEAEASEGIFRFTDKDYKHVLAVLNS